MNERRIGEKRHGELADDVEELLEADHRRQLFGEIRQERQRVALLNQRALAQSLGRFPLADLEAQVVVGGFQGLCAFLDALFQLGLRRQQHLLVAA